MTNTIERIYYTFIVALMATTLLHVGIKVNRVFNHVYTMNATVISIDENEILVESEDGNIWIFEDEDWKVNDTLIIYFDDNNTVGSAEDDEVVNYRITENLR